MATPTTMIVLLTLSVCFLVTCSAAPFTSTKNIVETAKADKDLTTFASALAAADLESPLSNTGPYTVFAPSNEAFAALPSDVLKYLLEPANKAELVKVLTYHVHSGKVLSSQLKDGEQIKMLEGSNVSAHRDWNELFIEGHNSTNVARVTTADIEASNGVIHIINFVLLPPASNPRPPPPPPGTKTIIEIAKQDKDLSTLVMALDAADLETVLGDKGPFTVFAPSNAAFAALPPADLEWLLEPKNKEFLVKILEYHVTVGKVQAADLINDEHIKMVQGQNVTVHLEWGGVYIEGHNSTNVGKVTTADVEASNGVVHIIDRVLLPPKASPPAPPPPPGTKTIVRLASENKDLTTLVSLLEAASLVETLSGTGPFTVFAPTNEAFAALPEGQLAHLLSNHTELVKVLTYHVVAAKVQAADLKPMEVIKTLDDGETVTAHVEWGGIFIEGKAENNLAKVVVADVEASNGVVHCIDKVLLPGHH
eukprot:m.178954 g.178954  ORF g.178954 m.178954 type:complete len:480 (+) comp31953_c4_seq1:203-1642(+)